MSLERRGFLASMGALAGFAALKPGEVLAAQAAQGWDMSWLDQLKGSHKQVFDLSDPANPAQKGELKMPGWMFYLEPHGDRTVRKLCMHCETPTWIAAA